MKITFVLHRTPLWLADYAIRTGDNAQPRVDVPVDAVNLGPVRRATLVGYFGGRLNNMLHEIAYTRDYEINLTALHGRVKLVSDVEKPTEADAIAAFDAAMEEFNRKREEYLAEKAASEEREEQERKEKEHQESLLRHARTLLKNELEELAKLKKYRTILSDVLSELTPQELQSATDKTDWDGSQVEEACEYSLNWE